MTLATPITASLLYRAGQDMPARAALFAALEQDQAATALHLQTPDSTGQMLLTLGDISVTLTLQDAPMPPEALAAALWTPIAALKPGDLAASVSSHARHCSVTLQGGAFLARLALLHRLTLLMIDQAPPVLVHWGLSDMLFTPAEVLATRGADLPVVLCLHPLPIFAPDAPSNSGFVALGSERFCGAQLQMMPSSLPLAQTIGLVADLLAQEARAPGSLQPGILQAPGAARLYIVASPAGPADAPARLLIGLDSPPDPDIARQMALASASLPVPARLDSPRTQRHVSPIGLRQRLTSPGALLACAAITVYLILVAGVNGWVHQQTDQLRATIAPQARLAGDQPHVLAPSGHISVQTRPPVDDVGR